MNKGVFYIYLSGPIKGRSLKESISWQEYVAKNLPPIIEAINPLRGENYFKNKNTEKITYKNMPLSFGKEITRQDFFDVNRSDAILVNLLGAKEVSIGSVLEMGWGYVERKPIILVMEKEGNPHDHPMLRETASHIVDNLDEAIIIAKKILLPGI